MSLPGVKGVKPMLARISHQCPAADADKLDVAVCAPCSRFDVVSTTTAPISSPRSPPQRHLDTLATNAGEKCGLAIKTNKGQVRVI